MTGIKKIATALTTVGLLASAVAQVDGRADVCNAVLSKGISDNYDIYSESEQYSIFQDRMCKANWESYGAMTASGGGLGIDIPLAEAIIGIKGDYSQKSSEFKQKYSNFCKSTYASFENKSIFHANVSKVSSALVEGWNKCIETVSTTWLQQYGILVGVTPYGMSESFLATIQVRSADTNKVVIKAIHPDQKVQCYRGGEKIVFGKTKIDSKMFAMTCYKDPNLEIPFVVEVSTPYASKPVKVPSNRSKLQDISTQMAILSSTIEVLEKRTPRLSCKSHSTGPIGPAVNQTREIRIPDADKGQGYFVTGGGCGAFEVPAAHNPILTDSRRTDDGEGWLCRSGDQKYTPIPHHLNVYVLYCKVNAQ